MSFSERPSLRTAITSLATLEKTVSCGRSIDHVTVSVSRSLHSTLAFPAVRRNSTQDCPCSTILHNSSTPASTSISQTEEPTFRLASPHHSGSLATDRTEPSPGCELRSVVNLPRTQNVVTTAKQHGVTSNTVCLPASDPPVSGSQDNQSATGNDRNASGIAPNRIVASRLEGNTVELVPTAAHHHGNCRYLCRQKAARCFDARVLAVHQLNSGVPDRSRSEFPLMFSNSKWP